MTKLPDCPRCGMDELYILKWPAGARDECTSFRLGCYWCNYNSDWREREAKMTLDEQIRMILLEVIAA